jgi:hypothetical protein
MSERLPYEEQLNQQWNELPLPDENMAWADMKRRLDDDNDGTPIVWWRRGCGLWGLLLLVLLGLGWWFVRPEQWFMDKTKDNKSSVQQHDDSIKKTLAEKNSTDLKTPENDSSQQKKDAGVKQEKNDERNTTNETGVTERDNPIHKNETIGTASDVKIRTPVSRKRTRHQTGIKPAKDNEPAKPNIAKQGKEKDDKPSPVVSGNNNSTASDTTGKIRTVQPVKPVVTTIDSAIVTTTSKDTVNKTTNPPENPVAKTDPKKDSTKKKSIFFSAGIAMNQQLPLAGQTFTPYNSLGRKGTLLDYIPSVYFRVNKKVNNKDKWFIQAEFRYGAPQYTKGFVYQKDTAGTPQFLTTISSKLKKTYYHQLPVTFNYYVLPNWSVGGGFSWNRFSSAISEKQVSARIVNVPRDTIISKGIVKDKGADSLFAKAYWQAIIETQYKWKRFSLGARYAFGLQPYIKFTLPGGTQQEERNSSLQLFLRYELWKSKEKAKSSFKP